ncbi:cupin domain-containing protein [Jiangella asiatica]|uniref:Cupin domain-containing protein n=1 Tax=Jiangella asiatica TaxID=2530372 RepID=A0A4R5CS72_9ACTN|nr:cupin domain-containing protein [Jiangella asiatica]TDE02230.1 cupin domain-containing protein [Jiangella asiatica]
MTSRHLVRRAARAGYDKPAGWAAGATGYRRWTAVGEAAGAVHTGFGVCELDPGGSVPAHVHSFEESFHVLSGSAVVSTPDGAHRVSTGDYGLLPVALRHAWRNDGDEVVRWAEMQGPQPRGRFDDDTFLVPELPAGEVAAGASPVDVRDPRTYRFGNITPSHMDASKQSQDLLAVSASLRTALLVYSGITVKMMVDSDLGAQLTSMFMVQYDPDGAAGAHDHPFEETYLILDGTVEASFDGERYLLEPGDIAWAGVGCVHAFANAGDGTVRWLETQAPQPPPRYSYRFARDWDYLRETLGGDHD